ncbi:dTMP kinase [Candidatus Omnitrophota bacterium]
MKKGKFITFEGSEGSGKSTHARLLCDYLKKKKRSVLNLREPGSTFISEKVRRILLNPEHKTISNICEAMLYMAARAQLVSEVIKPALKKGTIVICDRFLDATIVYQGYGHGIDLKTLRYIGNFVTQDITPEITFLLDIETKEGLRRAGKVKDRIEQRSLRYHRRVRRGYLALARKEPRRVKIIPVDGSNKYKTQAVIRKYVDKLL